MTEHVHQILMPWHYCICGLSAQELDRREQGIVLRVGPRPVEPLTALAWIIGGSRTATNRIAARLAGDTR